MIPALNTIIVTTGGGFDMPEIEDLLFPILLRSGRPRPANPEGEAALQATLTSIQHTTIPIQRTQAFYLAIQPPGISNNPYIQHHTHK